jgi:dTDP-glucose 4,6-dehydratase
MSWQGRQVLVTGAGGFIGSHLAEALVKAGARTRAMVHYHARGDAGHLDRLEPAVRQQIEVVAGDVIDAVLMHELVSGCDVVFHLAALIAIPYSYKAVGSYLAANVQGTYSVLEACRAQGVGRLVHTSTSEVYGTAQYVPIDERHPLNAQSPYAATKIAADQLAGSYHAAYGLPVVTLRPFNNFGPRQSARAVIPSIISQALASGRVELGSLDPVRDFLYVGDTARGYLAAGEAEGVCGRVYNLGTGFGVSIGQVVELVGQIMGRPLEVQGSAARRRPEASEVQRLICSAQRAADELGWRPEVSLKTGLERTVHWIDAHRELYRPGQYAI